jgi:hypothetical protein
MRYRLRTLLILLAVAPMLAAAPFIEAGPVIAAAALYSAIVAWNVATWHRQRFN